MQITRRSILQALLALPVFPLAKRPTEQQPASVVYTDSAGRTGAQLAALSDGKTREGGVSYNA